MAIAFAYLPHTGCIIIRPRSTCESGLLFSDDLWDSAINRLLSAHDTFEFFDAINGLEVMEKSIKEIDSTPWYQDDTEAVKALKMLRVPTFSFSPEEFSKWTQPQLIPATSSFVKAELSKTTLPKDTENAFYRTKLDYCAYRKGGMLEKLIANSLDIELLSISKVSDWVEVKNQLEQLDIYGRPVKHCECCGVAFVPASSNQKYCSDSCRSTNWQRQHRLAVST